jgi:hypothetical protein
VRELEVLLYDGTILRVGKTSDAELAQITGVSVVGGGDPGSSKSAQVTAPDVSAAVDAGGSYRRTEIYRKLVGLRDKYGDLVRQRFPKIPRRVSGCNLDELFAGKWI